MHNLGLCSTKIDDLQNVIKIYLMATDGSTERLGGLACHLVDILADLCNDNCSDVPKNLDKISIELIKIMYVSVIERLDGLGDSGAATHKKAQMRVGLEVELLPHLLFLKSIIVDLSIATKEDHTSISHKLQELISGS